MHTYIKSKIKSRKQLDERISQINKTELYQQLNNVFIHNMARLCLPRCIMPLELLGSPDLERKIYVLHLLPTRMGITLTKIHKHNIPGNANIVNPFNYKLKDPRRHNRQTSKLQNSSIPHEAQVKSYRLFIPIAHH